jgi:hypothetical protein
MAITEKWKEWEQRGSISLWHYEEFPKNFRGYHLTADRAGCEFLLGLIERFRKADYPAIKGIMLDDPTPTRLAVPGCRQRCIPAIRLELRFLRAACDEHWTVSECDGEVIIEMGANGLNHFERGIRDITLGKGDWAIGKGEKSLWFWW